MSPHSFYSHSLQFLCTFSFLVFYAHSNSIRKTYLVSINGVDPVLTYGGSNPLFMATSPKNGRRFDSKHPHIKKYANHLEKIHHSILKSSNIHPRNLLYSYKYGTNAFAVRLTKDEISKLKKQTNVKAIHEPQIWRGSSVHAADFLRLPKTLWKEVRGVDRAGQDIIIGIIDSGIAPENEFFSDKGYAPTPKKWRGKCEVSSNFPSCNRKIIGASSFRKVYSSLAEIDLSRDKLSPRDVWGHGTHVAGIAAGDGPLHVNLSGSYFGEARGVAPKARLAVYKVGWYGKTASMDNEASDLDIVAAIDQAIADGVDVINLSYGGQNPDFFSPVSLAFLSAVKAGIFVSVAAGNMGKLNSMDGSTTALDHTSPWEMVVGASTHDREYYVNVTLQNGEVIIGKSLIGNKINDEEEEWTLIDASSASLPGKNASHCLPETLDPVKVNGSIVLCLRGQNDRVQKSQNVKLANGKGMILMNEGEGDDVDKRREIGREEIMEDVISDYHFIPSSHVSHVQGKKIKKYIESLPFQKAKAKISMLHTIFGKMAPNIWSSSSRGPTDRFGYFSGKRNDILKPDIVAPGVNIWSAFPKESQEDSRSFNAYMLTGTSMASPMVAGMAALLKQIHPTWSPMMIKSAIMTSASQTNNKGKRIVVLSEADSEVQRLEEASPFDFGSGHIEPMAATEPGLVYDETYENMISFLYGMDADQARGVSKVYNEAVRFGMEGFNLNMPNIAVSALIKNVTVKRTVTNVWFKESIYRAFIQSPPGVEVRVNPLTLRLKPGQSDSFYVTFSVEKASDLGQFRFGNLVWNDGRHLVRSVLAVQPVTLDL